MSTALFITTCTATIAISLYKFKYGYFLFLLLYLIYPRILSIGVTGEGLVLSMERAQLIILSIILFYRLLFVNNEFKRIIKKVDLCNYILILPVMFIAWKIIVSFINVGFELTIVSGLVNDFLLIVMLVLITLAAIDRVNDLLTISKILFVGLFINFLAGIVEYQLGHNLFQELEISYRTFKDNVDNVTRYKYGEFRMQAFFSAPLLLAFFSVLSFPFIIRLNNLENKVIFKSALIFIPLTIFLTKSRSSLLLLIFLFGYWFYKKNEIQVKQKALKNTTIAVIGIGLLTIVYHLRFEIFGYVNLILVGQNISILDDKSVLERIDQFNVFRNVDTSVFFMGLGRIRYLPAVTDAINNLDNYFIRTFLEAGIVGLGILSYYLYMVYRQSVSIYRKACKYSYISVKKWSWIISLTIILTILVANLTSNTLINLFIFSFPAILPLLKRRIHQIDNVLENNFISLSKRDLV